MKYYAVITGASSGLGTEFEDLICLLSQEEESGL